MSRSTVKSARVKGVLCAKCKASRCCAATVEAERTRAYVRAYVLLLARRPLQALKIGWWWVTHRRVRASLQLREAATALPESYDIWLSIHQHAVAVTCSCCEMPEYPELAVHLHLDEGDDARSAERSVRSVISQSFSHWKLLVTSSAQPDFQHPDARIKLLPERFASHGAALDYVLKRADASYVIPLAPDCSLAPGALLAYAKAIAELSPGEIRVLYADQDEIGEDFKRTNPWFKPEWDEDLFLSQDYLSAACAIPVEAACKSGISALDEPAVYALLLSILTSEAEVKAQHVNYVATTTPALSWSSSTPQRTEVVRRFAKKRFGGDVAVGPFGTLRVRRPLVDPLPLVSVIVPTRDQFKLLEACVEGVLKRTDYSNLELIIADNGSVDLQTLDYMQKCRRDPRVKVVNWAEAFNYSAINNFAAASAKGSYLCLLNNDIEVLGSGWLKDMMAHAVRSEVGAVGALLVYPDFSVQHAGVVIGMGNAAGHAHRNLAAGEPGYFAQAHVARTATAVTAACLLIAKQKFEAVGGFDEEHLAVAYNDVDLCLKLRDAGWRNIYEPHAVLIHHEGKSRGLDMAPDQLDRYLKELRVFQDRWGTVGFLDPTHHRSLDPASELYRLKL